MSKILQFVKLSQSSLGRPGRFFGTTAVVLLATLAITSVSQRVALAQEFYQVAYYGNAYLGYPDAQMHVINPGSTGGTSPSGDLCANIYVFRANQQMIECCSCMVSPNGMRGFSLQTDLVGNPLTGPNLPARAGAIKIISSAVPPGGCDAGSFYAPGGHLRSLITHVRNTSITATPKFTTTETEFSKAPLGYDEYLKLVELCYDVEENGLNLGSGQGICSCGSEF